MAWQKRRLQRCLRFALAAARETSGTNAGAPIGIVPEYPWPNRSPPIPGNRAPENRATGKTEADHRCATCVSNPHNQSPSDRRDSSASSESLACGPPAYRETLLKHPENSNRWRLREPPENDPPLSSTTP